MSRFIFIVPRIRQIASCFRDVVGEMKNATHPRTCLVARSCALVCARVCGRVRRNALSLTDGSLNFDRLGGTLRALREREVGDPMIIVNYYYYYYYEAWNPYRTRTKIARYFTDGSQRFFFPLPTTRTLSRVLRYVSSSYRFAPWLILFVSPASRRTIIIFYCQLYALSDARYA